MKTLLIIFFLSLNVLAQSTVLKSSDKNQINSRTNNKFEIDLGTLSQINNMTDSSPEEVLNSLRLYFTTTSFFYSFSERAAKNPYVHENFLTQMKIDGTLTPMFVQALAQLYAEDLSTFTNLVVKAFPVGSFQEVAAKRDKVFNCFVEFSLSTHVPECIDSIHTLTILTPQDFGNLKFAYARLIRIGKTLYNFDYDRNSPDSVIAQSCDIITARQNELKNITNQISLDRTTSLGATSISHFASLPSLNPLSGPAFSHSKKGLQYLCKTSFNPLLD